jgi:hypothetical protein
MAERSKVRICGRSLAGILGSTAEEGRQQEVKGTEKTDGMRAGVPVQKYMLMEKKR